MKEDYAIVEKGLSGARKYARSGGWEV